MVTKKYQSLYYYFDHSINMLKKKKENIELYRWIDKGNVNRDSLLNEVGGVVLLASRFVSLLVLTKWMTLFGNRHLLLDRFSHLPRELSLMSFLLSVTQLGTMFTNGQGQPLPYSRFHCCKSYSYLGLLILIELSMKKKQAKKQKLVKGRNAFK